MFRMKFWLLALAIACLMSHSLSAEESRKHKQPEEVGKDLVRFLPIVKTSPDLKAKAIQFALCNVSDKPLIIHTNGLKRMTLVKICLYQDGKRAVDNGWTRDYARLKRGVRILEVGESILIKENISSRYFKLKPGRYEIRVSYDSHGLQEKLGLTPIRIRKQFVGYLDVEDSEKEVKENSEKEKDAELKEEVEKKTVEQ